MTKRIISRESQEDPYNLGGDNSTSVINYGVANALFYLYAIF